MKQKLLLFSLMFLPIVAAAQKVNELQALQIAQQFMEGKTFTAPAKARGTEVTVPNDKPYYVFNDQEGEGFVIVSGDERTPAILGYSDSGTFDYDNLPENAKAWIDGYAEQIKSIDKQDGEDRARAASPKLTKEVAPLLGDIAWRQDDPFNRLCPTSGTAHCLTGCGPTAMAQIMYYYRWPQGYGRGNVSYYDEACQQRLSADFSKSKYDWDKMLPVYSGHFDDDDEQAKEVAKLMRDCGFSVEAHYERITTCYGGDGTSSDGESICRALENYFDYKQTTCHLESYYYDKESWEQIIRNELDNKRPVLYGSDLEEGGHLFVCDGYDKNGFFHMNWGWGGFANGYYVTSALRGCDRGDIYCGIQRSIDKGNQIISPHADNDFKWSSGDQFSCALRVWTSVDNIELAIAVENVIKGTIQYLSVTPYREVVNHDSWVYKLTLKETPADGLYKVYPVARATGQDWEKFHFHQTSNYQEYVQLRVSNGVKTYINNEMYTNDGKKYKYFYNDIWYILDRTTHEAKATRFISNDNYSKYTASSLTISPSFSYNGETYTVTAIDEMAFSKSRNLTSITIPSSVKEIGASAFYGCPKLTSISLGDNITSVGPYAFYSCTALATVNFGDKITSIGHHAFEKCETLKSVKLPNGLTSIEDFTFAYCSNLAEVVIPATVTYIGEKALYGLHNDLRVKSLNKNPANPFSVGLHYSISPANTLIVPDGTKGKYMDSGWNTYSTIIEESGLKVDEIFRFMIDEYRKFITYKVTSTNPRTVEVRSIYGLTGEVAVPASVKGPDDQTYTVTSLGIRAIFEGKETDIIIPNTVTTIGGAAFAKSSTLKTVILPSTITSIGELAFSNCPALESVTVKAEIPISILENTFQNTPSLTTLYVPKGSETSYRNAPVWKDIKNIVGIDMAPLGDLNDDGDIDVTDVVELIDMVLSGSNSPIGDINGDGEVDVTDVVELIDIVLSGE
ncbi:MAG: C10 family peptidase [Prevotella sp.]|nr:C10 family peptidase [Prevotella sp.]